MCSVPTHLGNSTLHQKGVNPKSVEVALKNREVTESNSALLPSTQHKGISIATLAGPSASAIGDITQCVLVTQSGSGRGCTDVNVCQRRHRIREIKEQTSPSYQSPVKCRTWHLLQANDVRQDYLLTSCSKCA